MIFKQSSILVINKWYILALGVIFSIGCGEEEVLNSERVIGYWQVRAESTVFLNGMKHNEYTKFNWVEFYEDNSGQLYDADENLETEIKWSYQEGNDYDKMLISYRLSGSSGGFDLYQNELNEVLDFEENNFQLFNQNDIVVGDSTYNTNTFVYYVRQ